MSAKSSFDRAKLELYTGGLIKSMTFFSTSYDYLVFSISMTILLNSRHSH